MRRLSLALVLVGVFGLEARARPDEAGSTAPLARVQRPARPGDHGFLLLQDGSTLLGTFLSSDERGDDIEFEGGQVIRLPRGAVTGLSDRAIVPFRPPLAPPADGDAWIVLRDGRRLRGRVTARDAEGLSFDARAGALRIPNEEVDRIVWIGTPVPEPPRPAVAPSEPARVRYLSAPTAFQPEPREVTLSFTGLVQPEIGLGLTDFLSVAVGTTLPAGLGDRLGFNAAARVQAGTTLHRLVRVAAGVHVSADGTGSVGSVFATLTAGTAGLNASLHAGSSPLLARQRADMKDVAFALGGSWKAWSSVSLVVESWLGERAVGGVGWTTGAGARWSTGRLDLDGGFVITPTGTVPLLSASVGFR